MILNSTKETTTIFGKNTTAKTKFNFTRMATVSIMGGAFIAFGAFLTVAVVGGMPDVSLGLGRFISGALFPVGLILISLIGVDLFTSNCAGVVLSRQLDKTPYGKLLGLLLFSFALNFVGTQIIAYLFAYSTGSLTEVTPYLHNLAEAKINGSPYSIFVKGIAANWLVCAGTWMGYAAKDMAGKCIGIWVPIMLFVTLGFEHSIANMFYIPAAIYSGAAISWMDFITQNLIYATLGNFVGGALFVGSVHGYLHLKAAE